MEIIVSTTLVAILLVASLRSAGDLMQRQSEDTEALTGTELLSFILDEVSSQPFSDPDDNAVIGREDNETETARTSYDDVDDYHGLVLSPITFRDGRIASQYAGWSVSIDVQQGVSSGLSYRQITADESPTLLFINATYASPTGGQRTAFTLVSNVPSGVNRRTSFERYRSLQLTFADRNISVVAPLRNHPSNIVGAPEALEEDAQGGLVGESGAANAN